MSKYTRYTFTKKLYPDYLILIYKNGLYTTYNNDLKILKYLGIDFILKSNINYIILDNLDININSFLNNQYFYYLKIILVKYVLDFIRYKDESKY